MLLQATLKMQFFKGFCGDSPCHARGGYFEFKLKTFNNNILIKPELVSSPPISCMNVSPLKKRVQKKKNLFNSFFFHFLCQFVLIQNYINIFQTFVSLFLVRWGMGEINKCGALQKYNNENGEEVKKILYTDLKGQ